MYTLANRPIKAFSSEQIGNLTVLSKKLEVKSAAVEAERKRVRQVMADNDETPTVTAVTAVDLSITSISDSDNTGLSKKEIMIKDFKGLLANQDGLHKTIDALEAALVSTSTTGMDGEHVLEKVEALEAIVVCLYGADLKEPVLQSFASELYKVTVVTASQAVTQEIKLKLDEALMIMDGKIITITRQILVVQKKLMLLTGKPVKPCKLKIQTIGLEDGVIAAADAKCEDPSDSTGTVLTAAQELVQLEDAVTELRTTLEDLKIVTAKIKDIRSNSLTTGTVTSVTHVITLIVLITTKITEHHIDDELKAKMDEFKSITNVGVVEAGGTADTILVSILDILSLLAVSSAGSMSDASQG